MTASCTPAPPKSPRKGTYTSTPVRTVTRTQRRIHNCARLGPVTDPTNPPGRFAYTGYFNLVSVRTNEMVKYGLDLTPAGRARVHQELPGSNLYL
jgi:hypothetical protein